MFFDICRAVKPKYVFFENVKGLLNVDKGRTFRTIICKLDALGMMSNGKLLIANIMDQRKTEKECTLLDIVDLTKT